MSDEHKPHDDHGHGHGPDDHGHAPDAGHGHDDHGHAAPAAHGDDAHGHDAHGHAAADDHGHDDHGHDDHAHSPEAHVDHVEHASSESHGHDAHDDHGHHPTPAETTAAVAGGAAVAAAGGKSPVWSDHGDAPFEDVDATPVYARGKSSKKSSGGNEFVEIVKTILFALLIAVVLRTVLFQPFTIPSASMEPNLYEGDYIVVSKWSYGYSRHSLPFSPPIFSGRILEQAPHRGDIVVFKLPRDDGHGPNTTDYIKRLMGLPGDKIQMIDNVLYINGAAVKDVELSRADVQTLYGLQLTIKSRETLPEGKQITVQEWGPNHDADNTIVFEVPADHYFMIGDNRDNSQDSRFGPSVGVGMVPAENLIGKAQIILFSWSPGASLWNPVSWFSKIRPSRFFTVLN